MAELNSAGRVRPIFKGVWNASMDYGMLDVVTSTNKHAAYMALQTVPAGTLLNETSYWGKMIDAADGIIGNITQEASTADGGENKITVTMGDGTTKTFVVLNGKQGKQGNPGVSPSVSVSKSGTVTTISITDATGTKKAIINDGAAGKDGSNGSNGKDGTSCTHSWSGTTLTVTSASGTSSANLKGDPGQPGSDGSDGADGTSVTIANVSESAADGGSNVVTFSDGNTVTIKNGSKGSPGKQGIQGEPGMPGVSPSVSVSKSGTVTTISITDATGTKKATINDGAAGKDGSNGKDGLDATPVAPLFANSVEECTDTSKFYVLPDGFIYAYMYQEATGPSYTNLSETVHKNYRMGSSGALSALTGAITTDFIPVRKGQTVRFKGFNPLVMPEGKYPYICFYTGASESKAVSTGVWDRLDWINDEGNLTQNSSGVWEYTAFMCTQTPTSTTNRQHTQGNSITHIRMCGTMIAGETVVVTVDEEITEGGSAGGYRWASTGHAFVPAEYEAEITALRNTKADKSAIPTKLPNPNALTINGTEYDGSKAVDVNVESSGNILFGKKWIVCGDSFTHGGYNASDGFPESEYIYQDGRFAGKNIVYPYIIGLRNNMDIVDLASGGQTMAASSNSFMNLYSTIPVDADYITIMLGINDKVQGLPVGTLEDSTNTTFCGAYNIAMEHILENHPFAHIGIMVSNGTNAEIMAATRAIAERWGVPYLDFGNPQVPMMNRYTGRNVCAKAQQIREKNFCVISDGINVTNGHPNTAAHEYESTFIEAWLRTL